MNASTSHRTRRTTRRISPDIWVWILIVTVTALTLIMGFDPSRELPLPMTLANGALVVAWSIVWAGVRRRWLPAALLWSTLTLVLFCTAGQWTIFVQMTTLIALVGVGFRWVAASLGVAFLLTQAFVMPLLHDNVSNPLIQAAFEVILYGAAYAAGYALFVGLRNAREVERLHRELAASTEREKDLLLHAERQRSARDLHDGLGQQLTVLCMSLDYALTAKDHSPVEAWAEVAHARATASEALADMRVWVRAASPASPDDARTAHDWTVVAQSFASTGLHVEVEANDVDELPAEVHAYVHRLLQEGLTNAVKHGAARHARLSFAHEGNDVVIELFNNGKVPAATPQPGFGWRSLAGRAQELGGDFEAILTPGQGCTLRTRLPQRQLESV